jgi:UDP-glucose 4-epimerase
MKVLVTGGAGYIGSTVAFACQDAGHLPVIFDDLSCGTAGFAAEHELYVGDIADGPLVDKVFAEHPDIDAVVHCAAFTSVPDSVADPIGYYRNNFAKTVDFVDHLVRNGCRRLLFSSSAAVYGATTEPVVHEETPLAPGSPYARTKVMVEQLLADAAAAGLLDAVSLRYFNPIGVDPRQPGGVPSANKRHVLALLLEAQRVGRAFVITGCDWPTRDGTGLRDYIHVRDLARAHVRALERFDTLVANPNRYLVLNVGSGLGTTVRELIDTLEYVTGKPVRTVTGPRRSGDISGAYAHTGRAQQQLGWQPEHGVADAVRDALDRLDGATE